MGNKQSQKAGDNSQQMQAEIIVVNNGIDEKRAREIFDEKFALQKQEYTSEALIQANSRVKEFEIKLIPKILSIEKGLEAFADPAFQFLLREAQKSAASTERPADYDLLSELLVHRIQKGTNRQIRAGISRAVEIVEEISDAALIGLTVAHSVNQFTPVSGDIQEGLVVLNDLFGKLISGRLPIGNDWLDHLDVLDAIRITPFGSVKKIHEYYPLKLEGYVAVGIKKDSDEYEKAIKNLQDAGIAPQIILVEHALNSDYIRIPVANKSAIATLNFNRTIIINNIPQQLLIPLNDKQKDAILSVYDLYENNTELMEQNIQIFMVEWDKYQSLKILREWWDNISSAFQITSVGRVLAHANAQRCDSSLPSLD